MKKILKKILSFFNLKVSKSFDNRRDKKYFSKFGVNPIEIDYNYKENKLRFIELDIDIDLNREVFFVENYHVVKKMINIYDAKFYKDNGDIYINVNGLRINLQTSEEFFIINEVFVNGIYNLNTDDEYILFDIGMNVGITSLYFVSKKNVTKIFAFEPFELTYNQAIKNIKINKFEKIINTYNYGLGGETKAMTVDYVPDFRGSMGKDGVPDYLRQKISFSMKQEINIVAIDKVFLDILKLNPSSKFVFKVDCEGSEYEIIKKLDDCDLLKYIYAFFIEWHFKGPNEINEILVKNKYQVFSFDDYNNETGMIYASRKI
ncbi:FkbM family methyltransferase [Runella zeae]|uniref:FkbM family methyltransferase n=1 Tax=Runella zeae TaxID=94255 RepID=UPI0004196DE4|nr:FkbM family methyltransferase [Runella zeae]